MPYFTPAEDQLITQMRQAGHTYQEIGDAIGRTASNTYQRAHKLGIVHPLCPPPAATPARPLPRCQIRLAATPAQPSPDGLCAWCAQETVVEA